MNDDKRDPPIEPLDYLSGVTIVNIGDVRVARGMSRRAHSSCPHIHINYATHERRIWCEDCEHDVEGYDAFVLLVDGYWRALREIEDRERRVAEAEKFQIRSIAAKTMDEAWRQRNMVPCCPHCHHGLLPEDFRTKPGMVCREWAEARAKKDRP